MSKPKTATTTKATPKGKTETTTKATTPVGEGQTDAASKPTAGTTGVTEPRPTPGGTAETPPTDTAPPGPTPDIPQWRRDAEFEHEADTVWERVAKEMEAARHMAAWAETYDRSAHAASADGLSPAHVAMHVRSSREYRQDALRYLDKAVEEWRKWHPRDPFPYGDPDALRTELGGPLIIRPVYEARFRLTNRSPSWQSLGLFFTADAARAALRERFPDRDQPHDIDLAHFWIKDVSGDDEGGMLDAKY